MDGVILIDKPSGITSFDVVKAVRKMAGERKVGHAGTLDPLASGLLVVALGQGTKLIPYLMESDKRYIGTVSLGAQTDTDDADGQVIETAEVPEFNEDILKDVLSRFVGAVEQTPPAYSALKEDGVALYKRARRGEKVAPKPRIVEIKAIEVIERSGLEVTIDVTCKKGTYIRSLARDIALALHTRGHLKALLRTETSGFRIDDALGLDGMDTGLFTSNLLSLRDALPVLPEIQLDEDNEARVKQGQALVGVEVPADAEHYRLIDPQDRLLAIGLCENEVLRPVRVMVY